LGRGWAHGYREAARRAALRRYEVLDRPIEGELRAVAELAARSCGAPQAVLELDAERPDRSGLDGGEARGPVVVGDAGGLPAVASVPIIGSGGHTLGVLRVHADEPLEVDAGCHRGLELLAGQAAALLELRARSEALEAVTARFRVAFEHASVGMALVDASGCWARVNRALARTLGETQEALLGTSLEDVVSEEDLPAVQAAVGRLRRGETVEQRLEVRLLHSSGRLVWGALWAAVGDSAQGDMVDLVVQVDDITQRKAADEELLRRATHDPLTGLPNRLLLFDRLATAMERLRRGVGEVTLMLLDLDGFKAVNDTRGHGVGDQLLVTIGQRLRGALRSTDTVVRLGGDEFVVLCEESAPTGEGARIAERVLAVLGTPFPLDGAEVAVSASVGVATTTEWVEPEELLRRADDALYVAKASGRNRVELGSAGGPAEPGQRP
jgi:diguanylate cyclase (GGDEF)-like protein/PAS domain S-box-containing protein